MTDIALLLTAEELVSLNREVRRLLERWSDETSRRARLPGSRLVQWVNWTYPLGERPSDR